MTGCLNGESIEGRVVVGLVTETEVQVLRGI
jgi:hypothetical protein